MNDVEWSDLVSTWQGADASSRDTLVGLRSPQWPAGLSQSLSASAVSPAAPTQGFAQALLQRARHIDEWLSVLQTALGTVGLCGAGLAAQAFPRASLGAGVAALLLGVASVWRTRSRATLRASEAMLQNLAQGEGEGEDAPGEDVFRSELVVRPRAQVAAQVASVICFAGIACGLATLAILARGGHSAASTYTLGLSVAAALCGAGLLSGIVHNNWFTVGQRQRVRADNRGVFVNGALVVRPQQGMFGYVKRAQWGVPFRPGRSRALCITLYRLRNLVPAVVFDAEISSVDEGTAMLRALHLSEDRTRLDLVARSPWATPASVVMVLKQALVLPLLLHVLATPAGSRSPAVVAMLFALLVLGLLVALVALLPSRVSIGSDGVSLRWLGRKRFVAFSEVDRMEAKGGVLRIFRRDARPWLVAFGDREVCEAAYARIQAATQSLATARARGVAYSLEPSEFASLAGRESAYRIAAVTDDALAGLVRDANVPREHRVAAAKALLQRAPALAREQFAAELRVSADPLFRSELTALLALHSDE
jgi:hypothetical protein